MNSDKSSVIMRQLLVLAAIAGLAMAKPETYREKEDFQYSRSSSDEGTKAGYYGAQRGNMGGNYERAHNMDSLAQNQMGGLVRTVEGELGDGAKQHTGSVYTAAKSSGVYGSGLYDLSNLEGRNFQEGTSFGDSHSHSLSAALHSSGYRNQHSASNTARYSNAQILNAGFDSTRAHDGGYASVQNAGYNDYGTTHSRGSGYGRYNTEANSDQALYSTSHQGSNLESASQYEDRNTASQNSRHYSQAAGYQGEVYDQGSSLSHGSNFHSRLYPSGSPVKIVIRPGTRVSVPVAAQTYDASQSSSSFDKNAINSDTEVLNSNGQEILSKPSVKNYESSYSYRKEWEKHDTKPISGAGVMPLAIPTVNPYPVNSELYEDAQALILQQQQQQRNDAISSQSHRSSHSGYNSASSNQYNTQHHTGSNSGIKAYQSAYNGGATGASNTYLVYNHGASGSYTGATNGASSLNLVDDASTKPKSYQSSYSYHKSWERQGDPYVILPTTNGDNEQISGKLTAGSLKQGAYGSHQYGSHSQQHSHQGYSSHSGDDCDENGHIRRVRSPNRDKLEDLGQHTQNAWQQFGQQTQKQRVELGQQTSDAWQQFGQRTQKQREELGQQTHDAWQRFGQQTQNQREGLEQEIHDTWQQFGHNSQKQKEKLEDFGHQTQNTWDLFGQQTQKQREELGQRTHDAWQQFGQQSQNQRDGLGQEIRDTWQQFGQNTQTQKDKLEDFGHHTNNTWDQFGQQTQKQGEELGQRTDNAWHGHETKNKWDKLVDNGQQTLSQWGQQLDDVGRQTQNQWSQLGQQIRETRSSDWDKLEDLGQQTQNTWGQFDQESQQQMSQLEDLGQETQNIGKQFSQQTEAKWNKWQNEGQQAQRQWGHDFEGLGQHAHSTWDQLGQKTQNTWDKLEIESQSPSDLGQQTQDSWTGQEIYSSRNNDRLTEQKPSALDASSHHYHGMNIDHQSSDNTFEIMNSNNDEKHVIQSHTLEKDNTNKTHHVHSIWDEIKKEEIGQENEDTVEDLSQTADLGQQTQVTWDNINQKEKRPWYQDTVQTAYKAHQDLTNSEPNNKDNTLVTPNPHPWMYNQVYHHRANHNDSASSNQFLTQHSSSSSQSHRWEEHSTNTNANSNAQTHSTGSAFGSSIASLWDKLGDIEKHSIPTHESDQQKSIADIFGVQTQQNKNTDKADTSKSQTSLNEFHIQTRPVQNIAVSIKSTTSAPNIEAISKIPSDVERGDITEVINENIPSDEGRGDIGPENSNEQSKPDQLKVHKTPEEIDSLSLTKETNKTSNTNVEQSKNSEDAIDLRVVSLNQQQSTSDSNIKITSTTQRNNHINHKPHNGGENHRQEQPFENREQQNFDQQAFSNQFVFGQETESQQNTDQQVVDFGQQSENFGYNQMESEATGSFHQAKAEDLSQQNEQFDQVSLSGWNPDEGLSQKEKIDNENIEQQSQTGWAENIEDQQVQTAWQPETEKQQHSDMTETLSLPMEDLSQQVQNIGHGVTFHQENQKHKTENFNQQDEQFDQVSLSGFKADGQGSEDLGQQRQSGWTEIMEDQQVQTALKPEDLQQQSQLTHKFTESMENLDQQVQTAWKPSEDLQEQSQLTHKFTESMENLDQQVQTAWKPEDLHQQSQLTHKFTESMENLDQQVQTAWKPEDLHQQSQLTHKFTESMENLDQQVQTAWKPTEDLQQQSQLTHKFTESMENLDQQVQTAWKPAEDLQQQSQLTDTFSQMEQNIPPTSNHKPEVSEELIVPKKVATVDSPPEVTENPGFWKSVGNKFSNAKDKVSSWFSRS